MPVNLRRLMSAILEAPQPEAYQFHVFQLVFRSSLLVFLRPYVRHVTPVVRAIRRSRRICRAIEDEAIDSRPVDYIVQVCRPGVTWCVPGKIHGGVGGHEPSHHRRRQAKNVRGKAVQEGGQGAKDNGGTREGMVHISVALLQLVRWRPDSMQSTCERVGSPFQGWLFC